MLDALNMDDGTPRGNPRSRGSLLGRLRIALTTAALASVVVACGGLGGLLGIAEPRFTVVEGRSGTLTLAAPSARNPRGSATVRIWAEVENPNAFGLTLSTLRGTLAFEGEDLFDVDLPLGLPLAARADTVVPLDLTFAFESFSALGGVARRLFTRDELRYELRGTVGVDAGPLGEAAFGPRTWLRGSVDVLEPLSLE